MKSVKTLSIFGLISVVGLTSFWLAGNKDKLSDCPQVASTVQVGKNSVLVGNRALLKDTINLPLSELTADLQIVKLDPADNALVGNGYALVTDNYILVKGQRQNPYKLFDKKGKFLNAIGAFGQGPGEYQNVYHEQLDEKKGRVYLLPWQSDKILVYDLKGNVLDPIRLPMNVPKGKFFVDPSNATVSVFALPWTGNKYVAWNQKLTGEVNAGIEPGFLAINPRNANGQFSGFNHEVNSDQNSPNLLNVFFFTFDPRPDTLYHYDTKTNKLLPQFTVNFGKEKLPIHSYTELPNHFLVYVSEPKQISETETVTQDHRNFIVEKKTQKGAFIRLKNDFLGNADIWPSFSNGYFSQNMDPGRLRDELEKILTTNKNLSNAMRSKLTGLKNSITENDNNYILYAKLKK